MGLHWRLSAVEAAVFRAARLPGGLALAAPLLDGWRLLPGVQNPLGSGLGLGSKAQQFPSRPQQTPPTPAAHTQKHTAMSRLGGGEDKQLSVFSTSLPNDTDYMRRCDSVPGGDRVHEGCLYVAPATDLFGFFGCHMESRSPDIQSLMRIDHIT